MSRAFVRESDMEEAPIIPPRAALPDGIDNYVTAVGYEALLKEKEELEEERDGIPIDEDMEHRHARTIVEGKLRLLNERITSARIIPVEEQPKEEVRFGAIVEFLNNGRKLKFQIVGVDEANIRLQKVAFVSPIARALTGLKAGETIDFKLGDEIRKLKVLSIEYPV